MQFNERPFSNKDENPLERLTVDRENTACGVPIERSVNFSLPDDYISEFELCKAEHNSFRVQRGLPTAVCQSYLTGVL